MRPRAPVRRPEDGEPGTGKDAPNGGWNEIGRLARRGRGSNEHARDDAAAMRGRFRVSLTVLGMTHRPGVKRQRRSAARLSCADGFLRGRRACRRRIPVILRNWHRLQPTVRRTPPPAASMARSTLKRGRCPNAARPESLNRQRLLHTAPSGSLARDRFRCVLDFGRFARCLRSINHILSDLTVQKGSAGRVGDPAVDDSPGHRGMHVKGDFRAALARIQRDVGFALQIGSDLHVGRRECPRQFGTGCPS